MIEQLKSQRISFDYERPNSEFVDWLKRHSVVVGFDADIFIPMNSYFAQGLRGTSETMLSRASLVSLLMRGKFLLGKGCRFVIFDSFRSHATQLHLFEIFREQIRTGNPWLSEDELMTRTRNFVAHPDEVSRFAIPPHNSGGAIDISLEYMGELLDMGTDFDDLSDLATTNYFECEYVKNSFGIDRQRWIKVRENRRILFNLMKNLGFVNYQPEWWHYDLGDCIWAESFDLDWHYPSMEKQVT